MSHAERKIGLPPAANREYTELDDSRPRRLWLCDARDDGLAWIASRLFVARDFEHPVP
jgi:hypothetical protein